MQKGLSKGALERRPWDAHGARRGQGCPGVYEMTASIFRVLGERNLLQPTPALCSAGARRVGGWGQQGYRSRLPWFQVPAPVFICQVTSGEAAKSVSSTGAYDAHSQGPRAGWTRAEEGLSRATRALCLRYCPDKSHQCLQLLAGP